WSQLPTIIPLFVVVRIASLWAFRAYTSLWRYATLREALAGGAGVALGSVVLFTLAMTTSVIRLPRSVFAIEALLFAFAAGAPRFAVRWRRAWIQKASGQRGKRVLIVGAATPAPCWCGSLNASRTWACTWSVWWTTTSRKSTGSWAACGFWGAAGTFPTS